MDNEVESSLDLLVEMTRLKAIPRLGWLLRGVRDVESVAAHSYGVAFIAMLLVDRARQRGDEVDAGRTLRMALLHDLTEARIGDLPGTIKPYFDRLTLHRMEERVATEMLGPLGALGADWYALWQEYEERRTLESRLVKAADKLDLLLQAAEYEKGGAVALEEFWVNAGRDFDRLDLNGLLDDLLDALRCRRPGRSRIDREGEQ